MIGSALTVAMLLSLALLAWAIYELPRVWRNRPKHLRMKEMILSPQYRLSTAAIVIGITGALVFLLIGSPGYTITLQNIVQSLLGGNAPSAIRGVLLLSVLAGMLASTLATRQLPARLAAATFVVAQYFRRRADGLGHRHVAGRQ